MRIIYLANIRLPTEKAHGFQVMKTCEALSGAGAEVVLCVPRRANAIKDDPFDYYKVRKAFEIRYLPSFGSQFYLKNRFLFGLSQLSFALSACAVYFRSSDIVYARDEFTLWVMSLFKRRLYFEAHDGRWNFFMKQVMRRADGIVAITHGLVDFYAEKGISSDKFYVVPDAVGLSEFEGLGTKASLRDELGLPKDAKLATYSGSLGVYEWKGVDVFLESMGFISDQSVRFVFVGGSAREIGALRAKYPDSRAIFVERVPAPEVPRYLKASDVLILPNKSGDPISEKFTSPIKLFYYMASGVPIVASDLPSLREILDESLAFMVKPNDPRALAEGIEQSLGREEESEKRAIRALKEARLYTWEARARKILDFVGKAPIKTKDSVFFDKESRLYSEKRYPAESTDYLHFFFKRRLDLTIGLLDEAVSTLEKPSLLEVGCADGIVLRRIYERFGGRFASYAGNDISSGMIEAAKAKNAGLPLEFVVRGPGKDFGGRFDVIVEVGVLNYADFDREIGCAVEALPKGGYYLVSIAGRESLRNRFRGGKDGFANFSSYAEYETKLASSFEVVAKRPVGLFIPGLWRLPGLALAVQPLIETMIRPLAPDWFHEKVYLLRRL